MKKFLSISFAALLVAAAAVGSHSTEQAGPAEPNIVSPDGQFVLYGPAEPN